MLITRTVQTQAGSVTITFPPDLGGDVRIDVGVGDLCYFLPVAVLLPQDGALSALLVLMPVEVGIAVAATLARYRAFREMRARFVLMDRHKEDHHDRTANPL